MKKNKHKNKNHITSIKNILKQNIKLLIGLIIGLFIATGTVYGAIQMASSDVYYDKTASGLNSSNVQDAIDELKTKANSCGSSGGLQVGDYFTLVPDKSTYTIASSTTGYTTQQKGEVISTVSTYSWYSNYYYCCQSTKPTINGDKYTGFASRIQGNAIKEKYCMWATQSQTSCSAATETTVMYKPSNNASSTSGTLISSTQYSIENTDVLTDQTITPNELTLWRVIKINDNGTYDAVSEYVSSTSVGFRGTIGYQKYVGTLQTIAAQYAKSGYTVGTRMMGYDGQTLTISDTSAFDGSTNTAPSTTSTPSPTEGTGQEYSGGVLGDTLYLKDYQLVSNVYMQDNNSANYCSAGICAYKKGTTTRSAYWIASREYYISNTGTTAGTFYFIARRISDGSLYNDPLIDSGGILRHFYVDSSIGNGYQNWSDTDYASALRPIITLKSDVTISGGHGTKSHPFTFS